MFGLFMSARDGAGDVAPLYNQSTHGLELRLITERRRSAPRAPLERAATTATIGRSGISLRPAASRG